MPMQRRLGVPAKHHGNACLELLDVTACMPVWYGLPDTMQHALPAVSWFSLPVTCWTCRSADN